MLTYFITLITLAVIDAIWLFSMATFYKSKLAHLFASSVNFAPVILFYLLYAAGIMYFVINPAIKGDISLMQVAISGAFLGLIAYAAYDLTNHGTLKNWPIVVTIVDLAWGAVLTGLVAFIAVWILRIK